jgi:hypothetical protein
MKCASCGALNVAPPVSVATIAAHPATSAAPEAPEALAAPTPANDQFFAPAVFNNPVVVHPPARAPRRPLPIVPIVVVVAAVLLVAGIAFTIVGSGSKHAAPMKILTPVPANTGIPTGFQQMNRVTAESSRHTALQAVETADTSDLAALQSQQPSYTWVGGDRVSRDDKTISVANAQGVVTIAVSSLSREFCAFGRWSDNATPMYVTEQNQPHCRAVEAPATGWSTEAGGANTDLPDDSGG